MCGFTAQLSMNWRLEAGAETVVQKTQCDDWAGVGVLVGEYEGMSLGTIAR